MPKVTNRRVDKAAELMRLLQNGPSFSNLDFKLSNKAPHIIASDGTKLWLNSWVIPLVKELVPELKEKREQNG
jgi:hypothetical protein